MNFSFILESGIPAIIWLFQCNVSLGSGHQFFLFNNLCLMEAATLRCFQSAIQSIYYYLLNHFMNCDSRVRRDLLNFGLRKKLHTYPCWSISWTKCKYLSMCCPYPQWQVGTAPRPGNITLGMAIIIDWDLCMQICSFTSNCKGQSWATLRYGATWNLPQQQNYHQTAWENNLEHLVRIWKDAGIYCLEECTVVALAYRHKGIFRNT